MAKETDLPENIKAELARNGLIARGTVIIGFDDSVAECVVPEGGVEIADAVEKIYGVKVESVNLMNYAGKPKRAGRSPVVGRRANWKKAVVTLSEGEIELA